MPRIPFGRSAYMEEAYGLPPVALENLYAEGAGDRGDWGSRLIPTPGLVSFSTGGAKGRGAFQSDAIASGEIIVVYDTVVKRVAPNGAETTITGAVIDDDVPVAWAASQVQLVLNSGGKIYTVTGAAVTDFTANLTAAGASGAPIDVAVVNNRHLYVEDNSGRVFYSDPAAATTIDGFFTAERDPDQVKALLVVGSNLLVMGTRKTEFWTGTGSDLTPFIQRQGFILEYGVIGSRARAQIGGVGYWVAHDGTVRRWAGGGAERISDHWIERLIVSLSAADKARVRVSAHNWTGHEFVSVMIPGKGTFFFDQLSGAWHRRRDLGDETVTGWGYDYPVEAFGRVFCQKISNGKLLRFDAATAKEDGVSVRRVTEALAPIDTATRISNIIIEGQSGVGLDSADPDEAEPECMLRIAYDGRTFESEQRARIGARAQYKWRPVFGPQGTFLPPVAKVQLAYSSPVTWPVYGMTYNERVW